MKAKGKIALVSILLVIVAALFGMAFTDEVYFSTLYLDQEEATENPDGSLKIPFYLYKDAWEKYQANIVNLTFDSKRIEQELVLVSLEMAPGIRYSIDSLRLEFFVSNVYSAIRFEHPATGEVLSYNYELSGNDSKAVLEFADFNSEPGEKINIRFWLDLSAVAGSIEEGPVLYNFSMHENSILKIVRHKATQHTLQLVIPDQLN